jgi:Aldose 1-epimerase
MLQNLRKLRRRGHRLRSGNGRTLEVSTTEPGVQFYTSNHLAGSIPGKQGKTYGFRSAFCPETEHFLDSPNHPTFPSTEWKPGQRYDSIPVFTLSTRLIRSYKPSIFALSDATVPHQTNDVIESAGSTSLSARVPSVHCACCSTPVFVTTSTLLPSGFLAATWSMAGRLPEDAKIRAPL